MNKLIQFKNISKIYNEGETELRALDNINFTIDKGEFVVILGPSGAGKTTLLNILGGMDYPTKGELLINNKNIEKYDDNQLTKYRAQNIGFVFQFYNLLPMLTAIENINIVNSLVDNPLNAEELLKLVGLEDRKQHFPSQLSGGEQQRISIARALCKNPKLILCDEPTGALDSENGKKILELLYKMSKKSNKTVIIVTHNHELGKTANKIIKIKNGQIEDIIENTNPTPIEKIDI